MTSETPDWATTVRIQETINEMFRRLALAEYGIIVNQPLTEPCQLLLDRARVNIPVYVCGERTANSTSSTDTPSPTGE